MSNHDWPPTQKAKTVEPLNPPENTILEETIRPSQEPRWDKTEVVARRLEHSLFYEEPDQESRNGYWQGRQIIGRDSPINGGVYLGGGAREAIVVDDEKYELLQSKYDELIKLLEPYIKEKTLKSNILDLVFKFVIENLSYDEEHVKALAKKYNLAPDQKISLTEYINEYINKNGKPEQKRGGVCRHQALFGAYLLEKLKKNNYVQGNVSVDRNYVPGKGGHAWVRYANSRGNVFIIDPAQHYIGALEDIKKDRWFYERPEDTTR